MAQNKVNKSLAYQLISFVLTFMLIIFIVAIFVTRSIYSKVMLDIQLSNMQHLAHERIYLIDGILSKVEALAKIARSVAVDHDLSDTEKEIMLRSLLLDNPEVHSLCTAAKASDGVPPKVMYTIGHRFLQREIQGQDYLYQDWYQIPHNTGKPYWTEPWIDSQGKGEMVISYSMPLYQKGDITGFLRFDIELKYLQELTTNPDHFKLGSSFLVSSTGTLVAHRDLDMVMNQSLFSLAQEYNDPLLSSLGEAMIAGESGYIKIDGKSPFKNSWVYYQNIMSNRWSVGVSIEESVLMEDVNLILLIQTFTSILIFLLVGIAIYARALSVSRPLKKLAKAADRIGAGDFDAEIPLSDKSQEIVTLSLSFSAMQKSLKEYIQNLRITTEEKNQIRGDVIYASEIQTKLVPTNVEHPLEIKELRAYGILKPAGDIGGDLYDYFMIDDDHFCFVIADVLGKGIVAAMAMTMVSTLLLSIAPYYKSSKELLWELNKFLSRNNIESNFVTALLGVIQLSSGRLEYSNCGHLPLYIRKMDRSFVKYGQTHSTALGVFENLEIGSDIIQLNTGDEIILYTDGVTEAMNIEEEFMGLKGLEEIIQGLPMPNPENTAKSILNKVQDFARGSTHKDDITLLVIDYKHPGIT
ncbi:MAG: SpoIIE family protein phosphatase [Candidatus Cloacimonetes bacterium]|nr:SpoIIE family protein phosphatase [Candidatus Cloacimonadota bacterium]MCK9185107.1 SpoIIE family protein phosphatase [Candidatus Cloacimonadota bacterium]